MSRRSKGPRLWFRKDRDAWFILDGTRQRGTGSGKEDVAGAERALREYIQSKHGEKLTSESRSPTTIKIADVLTLYMRDVVPNHARPVETSARVDRILDFWGGHTLDYVTGPNCRAYAAQSDNARRELEDFRAAINHHRREGLHDRLVSVVLPPRGAPRERWLTRAEAAALIRAAWHYRERQGGPMAGRRTRQHVARFMVVARYMGSRAAVICGASLADKRPAGEPWVDLTTGIFYGRPEGQRATKKRRQVVPVPPKLLAHMRRWRRLGQRYVVEWNRRPVKTIGKAHRAAVADAGLGPEVTPHVWRHTVATWTAQKQVPAREAAEFLAMSVETYLRVYGHHDPSKFGDVHRALR